ncbi:MAG: hypothetical protein JWM80_3969 [Cyanobacteria bacterium RYN_339]|nr:hypothetical protein [Cyanobacteria bacterium RYN_339]
MNMDLLNFGTEDTAARVTLGYDECKLLMDACSALREAQFPGLMEKLPRQFDENDLTKAVGEPAKAAALMNIFELEQSFHQALHMFPQGHDHGHNH